MTEGVPSTVQVGGFTADDPSPQNVANYSATIDWGDGTTSAGVITVNPVSPTFYDVSGTHLYKNIVGSTYYQDFLLTITVTDAVDAASETGVFGQGLAPGVRVLNAGETWTGRSNSQVLDAIEGQQFVGTFASLVDNNPFGRTQDYAAGIYLAGPPNGLGQPTASLARLPQSLGRVRRHRHPYLPVRPACTA